MMTDANALSQTSLNQTLHRALSIRLERWDGLNPRTTEDPATRAIDLSHHPLFLLGAGAVLARPFVRTAVQAYDVRGLVDNQPSPALRRLASEGAGVEILDDAGFCQRAREDARAVAVLCASSEAGMAHFSALATAAEIPALTLIQALRRTGEPDWAGHFADAATVHRLYAALDQELCFADAISRATYCAVLLHRLTGATHWLDPVRLPERAAYFFTDALEPHMAEVLVDGGAFTGDTLRAFAQRTQGHWSHLHAFEPDPACHAALQATVAGLPQTDWYPAGLWSATGAMPMVADVHARIATPDTPTPVFPDSAGSAGRSPAPVSAMPVVALDERDLGPVSLIKMDIEGAEYAALEGARHTLAQFRPRLAVCVYHRPDDLLQIPRLLATLRPESQFRLRHHGPTLFETVLYVT